MLDLSPSFDLTAEQIAGLLDPTAPLFPELDLARKNPLVLKSAASTQQVLASIEQVLPEIASIPQTPYTAYRMFTRNGDRQSYERPYFTKRARMAAAVLHYFFGRSELKDLVQDYIWDVCEETTWVLPAHETRLIDLFSAETGLLLAEILNLLGPSLDEEVRHRVRQEIERQIFQRYIHYHHVDNWYMGHNNWNGVCNSSVAMTFLLLEPETERVARALQIAFRSLKFFLATAFEADGTSTEGASYWGYGLLNLVPLSEMLRSRSHGQIDLLQGDHMKRVAAYPAKVALSGIHFASFSDCNETKTYEPGIICKLAERTGEQALLNLTTYGGRGEQRVSEQHWRVGIMLRNMLWWDGVQHEPVVDSDTYLPNGAVARLVGKTAAGAPVVLAIKAGHNAENHNQNDVGSFIVHIAGQTFLSDPGRGLYSRQYFGPERYNNIFASSYGHSVPRIGGKQQAAGPEFTGTFIGVDASGTAKAATVDIARAYPVDGLQRLLRTLMLDQNGAITLSDEFQFGDQAPVVEEVMVTWLPVEVHGATAVLRGEQHNLRLTVEQPAGATVAVESLEEASRANQKPGVLKRITFTLPASVKQVARVVMVVE